MKECVKALLWSCHAEVWSVLDSGVFLESNDRDKGHDFWEPGAPWPTAPQSFAESRRPSRGVLLTEPLHGPLVRAAADPLRRSAEGLFEQGYTVCCQPSSWRRQSISPSDLRATGKHREAHPEPAVRLSACCAAGSRAQSDGMSLPGAVACSGYSSRIRCPCRPFGCRGPHATAS